MRGFEKDKYAYEKFSSSKLPIPETVLLGNFNENLVFSITYRAKGKLTSTSSKQEVELALPNIIETLDAIHQIDISDSVGYGAFDSSGNATLSTFREHLDKAVTEIPELLHKNAACPFLEADVVNSLLEKYKKLLDYCPNVRYLVHGDYGFNNLMIDGDKVTGVFDWEHGMYGDFLYDVAWLDFWGNRPDLNNGINYADVFLKHYQERGVEIENYHERVLLHKLNLGIKSLTFYAYSNQEHKYNDAKAMLLKLTENI